MCRWQAYAGDAMQTTKPLEEHLNANGWTTKAPTVAGQGTGPLPGATLSEAVYVRLPKPRGRCPLTGLCRSSLANLLDEGLIRGVTIRRHGARRGIRLIYKDSLLAYLRSLEEPVKKEASP